MGKVASAARRAILHSNFDQLADRLMANLTHSAALATAAASFTRAATLASVGFQGIPAAAATAASAASSAPEKTDPAWWVELIKVSPGLVTALIGVALLVLYYREIRLLFSRMTKIKALGVEAEFADKTLSQAIVAQHMTAHVSADDKKGVLKRLALIGPLLAGSRILWVDDNPANNRNERALLEGFGARVDSFKISAEAELALKENVYLLAITDLEREGRSDEGLLFLARTLAANTQVWTIAYVASDQRGMPRPADLFGITNRPDHLMHLICDIVEREKI